ncbi:hypothetical protein Taro_040542 [Colocasia esculenta]|uniref:Uncharacterized protein n=1 Tax=Colocasia esculenta TaxID=4460 RepID=A0A843WYM3_COLES|nr:hypothetical protein [Colocasia esculenta]
MRLAELVGSGSGAGRSSLGVAIPGVQSSGARDRSICATEEGPKRPGESILGSFWVVRFTQKWNMEIGLDI